jgi:hypothetical protein
MQSRDFSKKRRDKVVISVSVARNSKSSRANRRNTRTYFGETIFRTKANSAWLGN